jgi:hypothetical protein
MKIKNGTTKKSNDHGNGNGQGKPHDETSRFESKSSNGDIPREQMIAQAAYFSAERRGFAPGNDVADWLMAEADVARQAAAHA